MLSTNVKTADDLMTIALQAEREAIRRYSELADNMRAGHNASAAALFERLVIEEQDHERLILEWMAQEKISESPDIGPIRWRDPQISTTYDNEAKDPYYSTPYRALAFAVHNEEIAFRFYTHVAADSDNQAVRQYAEILAREELGHAALLRAERRHAYHAEHDASIVEPRLDPGVILSEADLLAAAVHIDRHLSDEMSGLLKSTIGIDALAGKTRQLISENENALKSKVPPGEGIRRTLEGIDSYNAVLAESTSGPDDRIQHLCACADRSFTFYDAVVETTADEAIMQTAQKLSEAALDRIGVLKRAYGDSYLSDSKSD